MGFPASQTLEKTYRNNIQEVADFLNINHKDHYILFNLSNRKVDENFFETNKYFSYPWKDHHSPCLFILFDFCITA